MDVLNKQIDFSENIRNLESGTELDFYIKNAYNNFPFFLKSITKHNSITYAFFGDIQKDLFYISDNMRDDFGFESNLVPNLLQKWRTCIHGEKWKKTYDNDLKQMLEPDYVLHDLHYQVKDKNGNLFWIRCCGDLEWNEDHTKPLFFAGRVTKQSDYFIVDPISNFPITNTLQHYLEDRQRNKESFWTIGFCLNEMSKINALHSNNFANKLIRDISIMLTDELGEEMTFYKLTGVRCIAVPDKDFDKNDAAKKIRNIIERTYKQYGLVVDNPCSLVAMKFPQPNWQVSEFLENIVALIKLAHHEKQKDCIINTEENIKKIHEMSNLSMKITEDVLNNMKNFRPVVQPVVSTVTGKIIAGETLMRWQFKENDISPAVFIPILEKDRMIQVAGRWIFEQAVIICSNIVKQMPDFYLTVNVSLQQLYDEGFVDFISSVLEKYKLSGKHIVIEMTESCMDNEPAKLMELVNECKKVGIRLALDDFGTGYSSLRVLMQYPIDIIKIDRSLLLEMEDSEEKNNFITNLIHACHQFCKKICVEGVENPQQNKLVKKSNGDMIQGFFYYKPLEIDDIYKETGVK